MIKVDIDNTIRIFYELDFLLDDTQQQYSLYILSHLIKDMKGL